MTTTTLHATGPLGPAQVWDRYLFLDRWPAWAPQITGVDCAERVLTAGARGRVRAPLGVRLPFTIEAVDPRARSWSWTVAVGPLRLHLHHWVADGPGGGTTAGLRTSGPAPLVLGYAPAASWALRRLVR
ncbi:SRPBCC family protein [Trujillonella endophytica]|uniref:Polyketide cyclase / dehydrase and lipid transport n=1 Tax=Trujillonella endophytica TaxID=673521 RepID=A0A1H8VD83_9ACTN|nr:SRPBCC family protein [Trujillella endophytica]SEP13301.1 Polyketide cyclase / dehydrase and lipid transport [Trujillella endophytica]